MLRRAPIRLRLTLAFACVMALVLALAGLFIYLREQDAHRQLLDQTLRARIDDLPALLQAPPARRRSERDRVYAQLLDGRGRVLAASPLLRGRRLLPPSLLARARERGLRFDLPSLPGFGEGGWRVLTQPTRGAAGTRIALVTASREEDEEALHHLLAELLLGGAGVLVLASLGGYLLAAAALRPVEALGRQAAEFSLSGREQRLPVPVTRDEIARLAERLNEMLVRIEAAFAHERRFVAEASHELSTPLTILKAELDLALRRKRSAEELEEVLASASDEADRLAQFANDLLFVARADDGALPVRISLSPAAEIVAGVADRFAGAAAEAGRRIESHGDDELRVACDPVRVGQALSNLVENALRYGAGTISISARGRDGGVEFHVCDEGAGFPAAYLPRAFERFSRADDARGGDGSGLGLAIVEAIAQAHGGSAAARNREGGGSDVSLTLPQERR